MENYTSLSSWVSAIEIALQHTDIEYKDIIQSAQVPEHITNNPYLRTDVRLIAKAWDLAVERTANENLGILAAPYCRPAHWHALGLAMLCSNSVRDALLRVSQYNALLTNVTEMHSGDEDGHFCFRMKTKIPVEEVGLSVVDFGYGGLLTVCRSIFPGDIIPSRVCLQRPKPKDPSDFYTFYGTEVEFDCEYHTISIPDAIAQRQLDHSDPSLAAHQDSLAKDYIHRVIDNSTSFQTREKIIAALPRGEPSQQHIAEQLNVSQRQLQRLLQKENTSFKTLLKMVRMELAEKYLQQDYRSITEVALQLGFADHSNFTRAFKGWFGCTPTQYRSH